MLYDFWIWLDWAELWPAWVLLGFIILLGIGLAIETYQNGMKRQLLKEDFEARGQEWIEPDYFSVSNMEQVYQGNGGSSAPVLSKSDHQIFNGSGRSGTPAYSIHGDKIYRGSMVSGNPVATISGDSVYLGNAYSGNPLATISGNQVYQGKSYSGTPLATASSAKDKELLAAAALKALGH
jgi:hypothetical protein